MAKELRTEIGQLRSQSASSMSHQDELSRITREKNDEIATLKVVLSIAKKMLPNLSAAVYNGTVQEIFSPFSKSTNCELKLPLQAISTAQKEELRRLSRQTSPKKRHNSTSSQTDEKTNSAAIERLRVQNDELRRSQDDFKRKLVEATEKIVKSEILAEKQSFDLRRLTAENDELQPLRTKCNMLQDELRNYQKTENETEMLRTQLQASLDDRHVFEQRYLQVKHKIFSKFNVTNLLLSYSKCFKCVEALKVGQVEIDKRHSLVLELHEYSMAVVNDFQALEREKQSNYNLIISY